MNEGIREANRKAVEELRSEVNAKCGALHESLSNFKEATGAIIQNEIRDKVRVEEVQDALKRLAEGFDIRVEASEKRSQLALTQSQELQLAKLTTSYDLT